MFRRLLLTSAATFLALPLGLTACDGGTGPVGDGDGDTECTDGVCILSGTLTEDMTLTADTAWLLRGGVFIGDDVNETILTIEPGTQIFGESSTIGMLVVTRGSKIVAEGTAEAPIVFSSSKEEGSRSRGDWGGLILNGRAPVNGCNEGDVCETFGEGGTGWYGGNDVNDSSGVLKYVRVEFAGQLISPDNELNGIAFQGVGAGTEIDYVQIHMAKDDCIEFFGGTAQAKHILCTGSADDNLDWTDGWVGKMQFFVAQQYEDAGDNGIEADNNGENNGALPRSNPTISNITLIGSPESDQSDVGMLIREGTGASIHNAVVKGFNDVCLDIDHLSTFENAWNGTAPTGGLVLENIIFDCATNFEKDDEDFDGDDVDDADPFDIEEFFNTSMSGNAITDPMLEAPFEVASRDFRPAAGSPARTGAQVPSDSFFDSVSFIGGVDPDMDWTAGWTVSFRD